MKTHALLRRRMTLFLAVASVTSLVGIRLQGDPLKPIATLGTPKAGATFGVGFAEMDSHLAVAFSPDGRTLASSALDGAVRLWDVTTGKERTAFQERSRQVWSVMFSPDGKMLALGGWERQADNAIGGVWLRDVESGKEIATFGKYRYPVYSVTFSPDGKTLAAGGDDRIVHLWDVPSGRETASLSKAPHQSVFCVAFSPDGKTLAAAGGSVEATRQGKFPGSVRLWDVASQKEIASLQGHSHWVSSVAFSPDGKMLASGSYDGTVRLWDVTTAKQKALFKEREDQCLILAVAFSPDGMTVAFGGTEPAGGMPGKGVGTVRLWDVATGKEQATFEANGSFVTAVAFSPDGKILASGNGDSTAKLWSVPAATTSATAASDAHEEAVKREKKNLIGVWKLVSCETEYGKVPEEILKGEVVRWTITDSTIASTVEKEDKGEDKYTLDPTTNPKAIDLTDKEGHRTPGIYSLDGDTLKVCIDEGSEERPKVFASKPDTHLSVSVFKRERR